jgi:FixJ family two-component response regulator
MIPGAQVYLVDDDDDVRFHLTDLLRQLGYRVHAFGSAPEFLMGAQPASPAVLVLDMRMPVMNGLDVQQALKSQGWGLPIVFISGESQSQEIIDAMKGGAVDFLWKPFAHTQLKEAIDKGLGMDLARSDTEKRLAQVSQRFASLSPREVMIFELMRSGHGNKAIASVTGIMADTVKKHRAQVLAKMQVETLADLLTLCKDFAPTADHQ